MDRDRAIAEVVIEALKEVQALGGHEWAELPSDAKVIGTLAGFDSLTAVETTVLIETKLAVVLDRPGVTLGRDSIFVSDDARVALTLEEVVAKVGRVLEGAK